MVVMNGMLVAIFSADGGGKASYLLNKFLTDEDSTLFRGCPTVFILRRQPKNLKKE
jgi:hypothetical protein